MQITFELTAESIGDDIAARLDLPERASMLDIGGGHGWYSVALCKRYPSATTAVLNISAELLADAGLDGRIDLRPIDYEVEAIEATADAALLFNVVHGHDRSTNREFRRKAADGIGPGGQLAILDQFADEARASIVHTGTRGLDLTYLVSGDRTYHTDDPREWLEATGFRPTDRPEFTDRNTTLVVGEGI
ncbi:MAG: SAM-dependent methyltransferase [Halobacteriota archaeon]